MNLPQESANGWEQLMAELKERGVNRVGSFIADGLKGLDMAIFPAFPGKTTAKMCDAFKTESGC